MLFTFQPKLVGCKFGLLLVVLHGTAVFSFRHFLMADFKHEHLICHSRAEEALHRADPLDFCWGLLPTGLILLTILDSPAILATQSWVTPVVDQTLPHICSVTANQVETSAILLLATLQWFGIGWVLEWLIRNHRTKLQKAKKTPNQAMHADLLQRG